jgi:hypothetical protein
VAEYSQFSQIICSQQGVLKALTASLLQIAQRNLIGTSSCGNELGWLSASASRKALLGGEHTL